MVFFFTNAFYYGWQLTNVPWRIKRSLLPHEDEVASRVRQFRDSEREIYEEVRHAWLGLCWSSVLQLRVAARYLRTSVRAARNLTASTKAAGQRQTRLGFWGSPVCLSDEVFKLGVIGEVPTEPFR